MDLRIERLQLSGNGMQTNGLSKVTEYVWNCPDALLELDLSANQVEADPNEGPTPGNDPVSALLRCLYNHAGYPQIVRAHNGSSQVLPLTLRLGGNRVKEPARLLKNIEAKGGKTHVNIRPSPEPYDHVGKEYLSVCLPEFLSQATAPKVKERTKERKRHRSRSGEPKPRVVLTAAADTKGAQKQKKEKKEKANKVEKAEKVHKTEKTEKAEKSKKSKRKSSVQEQSPQRSGSEEVSPKKGSSKKEKSKKSRKEAAPAPRSSSESGDAPAAPSPTGLKISDEDQQTLQRQVGAKLKSFAGLASEDGTRDMLSEFVVCMAVAGKGHEQIHGELAGLVGDKEATTFVEWFGGHIERREFEKVRS